MTLNNMISIIIPVYNQAEKIVKTFESILKQTHKDIEVIVVNDGSKDGVEKIAEKYSQNFSQADIAFKYFHQENKGAPAARNKGWRQSKGEYLFFSDADAILDPNALQILLDGLNKNPEASFAYPSFYWGKKLFKGCEYSAEKLRQTPYIHTMSLIRRADFPATGWDESIKKFQDWDLWLTMSEQGHKGIFVDQILFSVLPGGTISNWLPSFAYKYFPWLPQVKRYDNAMKVIKEKHRLV